MLSGEHSLRRIMFESEMNDIERWMQHLRAPPTDGLSCTARTNNGKTSAQTRQAAKKWMEFYVCCCCSLSLNVLSPASVGSTDVCMHFLFDRSLAVEAALGQLVPVHTRECPR